MSMEKIENMNLADLRNYACPKVSNDKEWYMRCLSCDGINDCRTGKRVRDILEDQTKPTGQIEKFNERVLKTINMRIEEALKHKEAAKWLVEQGYYANKQSAWTAIYRYKKRHNIPVDKSEAQSDRIANIRERICRLFEGRVNDNDLVMSLLRDYNPGTKLNSVYNTVVSWAKHHPDLEERFHFLKPCIVLNRRPQDGWTVEQYLKSLEPLDLGGDMDGDAISIEDFLMEVDEPKSEKKDTDVTIIERVSPRYPVGQNPFRTVVPTTQILQTEFERKKQELQKRIDYIQEQIAKLSEQKKDFAQQMEMLDKTAVLFGMRPTA